MSNTSRVLSAHEILVVPCPTCGADKNMPCKPASGQRRIQAHRERQWAASDKRLCDEGNKKMRIRPRREILITFSLMRWPSYPSSDSAVHCFASCRSNPRNALRRVKECAPGRESPSSSDRESFDDKHGSGTFWAAETSGLGGRGSDGCGGVRRGIVDEQALTEG